MQIVSLTLPPIPLRIPWSSWTGAISRTFSPLPPLLLISSCPILSNFDIQDAQEKRPTDIAAVPDELLVDKDDVPTPQSDVMKEIIGNSIQTENDVAFYNMTPRDLPLSRLKDFYSKKDKNVLNLLASRRKLVVDDDLTLKMGVGQIRMDTKSSMIDYHLTVGNCLGLSPLLPNILSDPQFCFEMDLKKPFREFKGKNAMLGFDPTGRMLYIGRCRNEDVFLAMAPNGFLDGHFQPTRAGYSTGPSTMSKRHYRQTAMMLVHFLAQIEELSFLNTDPVYDQNLNSDDPKFHLITDVL
jgi:hypothetical protein